jgi:hypothetical protein
MPFWNSLEDVLKAYKVLTISGLSLGILAAVCAFLASISAIGTHYYGARKDELSAIATRYELDRVKNKIHSFTVRMHAEYNWELPNNPLLDEDQGGGIGEEDHLQLIRDNHDLKTVEGLYLKRTNQYQIKRISDTRASFDVDLVLREQGFPIGFQTEDLNQIKNFRALIPVKNYWMNGRDTYKIQVSEIKLEFIINGAVTPFHFNNSEFLIPSREHTEVLWGYLTPVRNFNYSTSQ